MYADEVEKERGTRKTFRKSFTSARGSGIEGKWKRDMFQTGNRSPKQSFTTRRNQMVLTSKAGSALVPRNITTASIRQRNQPPTTAVREVQTGPSTLFISNLASTVTQEDLEELFEQYHPEVVQLHFDSNGTSLGTADVVVPQPQVAIIQKNLEGVLLDGQQIEVLETNTAKQVSVFDRIKKVGRQNDFKPKMRVTVQQKGARFVKRGGGGDF
uniref:RRM domain-containing protein n=2 Tax=Caenorhabditis japonica TaxID=281687 RepID=A0A8R1DPL3_CAEJA